MPLENSPAHEASAQDRSIEKTSENTGKDLSRGLWDEIRNSAPSAVNRAERRMLDSVSSVVDLNLGDLYQSTFQILRSSRRNQAQTGGGDGSGDTSGSDGGPSSSKRASDQQARGGEQHGDSTSQQSTTNDGSEGQTSGQPAELNGQSTSQAEPIDTAHQPVNRQAITSVCDAIRDAGLHRDAEDITRLLQDRTRAERRAINEVFQQEHGVSLEQFFNRALDGADRDRVINLLNRRDGDVDRAGRIHATLVERGQLIEGRSDAVCEQDLRDTISSLNSADIAALDQEYRRRYHVGLSEALLQNEDLSQPTRQALEIYLRGSDRLAPGDTARLADIALEARDTTMFQEAFRNASPEARRAFMENKGEQRLQEAFGRFLPRQLEQTVGHRFASLLEAAAELATSRTTTEMATHGGLTDVDRMRDFVLYGRLSTATRVRDNTSAMGDNERAIETALETMPQEERQAYLRGRELATGQTDQSRLSEFQRQDLATYRQLRAALEGAGNSTEIARWEDMIRTGSDQSLIARLMTHRGSIYDDRIDDVMHDIENMSRQDWQRLHNDPSYRQAVQDALGTFLEGDDLTRLTSLLERQAGAESYEQARSTGRRSVVDAIRDATGGLLSDTRERQIVEALAGMTPDEQRRYREDRQFQSEINRLVRSSMEEGPELEAAERVLERVENGLEPELDIITRLNLRAAEQNESDRLTTTAVMAGAVITAPITLGGSMVAAGAYLADQQANDGEAFDAAYHALMGSRSADTVRDLQQAFRDDPQLRQRLLNPSNDADRAFRDQFYAALRRTMSESDVERYVQPLIREGHLEIDRQMELNRGLLDDNERASYQDIVNLARDRSEAAQTERRRILNEAGYRDQVLAHLSQDERAIALNALRQGEMRPEDLIRSHMVGAGTEEEELQAVLDRLTPQQREQVRREYERKYGDLTVDLLDELGGQDLREALRAARREPATAAEAFDRARDEVYESRDGLGRLLVDSTWDGTGHAADDALHQYAAAMSGFSSRFQELPADQRQQLEQNLQDAVDMYVESEGAAADAVVDAAMAIAAVGGAAYTGGVSLSLLAATGIGGAAFRIAARSIIMGGDYDFQSMTATDAAVGAVDGIGTFFGASELGAALQVGAAAARTAARTVAREAGERLVREGAEELLQQSLTRTVSESVLSGSYQISEETVDRLARQVARQGLSDASQQELSNLIRTSLAQATERESRLALERTAARYGLNMAGGAFGGGSSGMVRGVGEWDTSRTFGENLQALARTTFTSAAFGAAGAGTFTAVFDAASPLVRGIRKHFRVRPGQELSSDQLHEAARLTGLPDARLRQTSRGDLVLEANAGSTATAGSGDAPQVRAASRESSPAQASGARESGQDAPPAGSSIHRDSSPALTRASHDTIVDAAPPAGMEEPAVRVSPIRSIGDRPVVTRPIHRLVDSWRTPEAIDASNRFTRNHRIDERLPNGWQYVEQRRFIGPDGVATGRDRMLHSVLVDRNTDQVLRFVIQEARQQFQHLPPAERAEALQNYVNKLLRPDRMTEEGLDTWYASFLRAHDGHRIPLGEFIAHGQGVCSQRAILLKVLGDELGLNFRLVRGSGGANPAEINHVWTEIDLPGQGTRIFDPRQLRAGERAEDFPSHYHGSAIDSGAVRPTIIEPLPSVNVRASAESTARTQETLPDGTEAWGSVPQDRTSGSADVPATAPRDSTVPEPGSLPPEQGHGPGPIAGSVPISEIRAIRQDLVEGVEMDEASDIVRQLRTAEDPVISVPMEHLHSVLSEGGISARPTWTGHRLLVGTLGRDAATFGQQRFLVRVINRQIQAMPRATGPNGLFHGVIGFNRDSMRLGQDIEIILPDGTVITGAH